MDFSKAVDLMAQAELEIRMQISKGNDADYDAMFDCLKLAQRLHGFIDELSHVGETVATDEASDAHKQQVEQEAKDVFPLYFVHEDKLWKVSLRSGDSGELYKKSLPFADVKILCSKIHELLDSSDFFSMASLDAGVPAMPSYKSQITVMALVKAGLLESVGRGKYALTRGASRSERKWIETLKEMNPKPELL